MRATLWIPGPPVNAEVVLHRLEGQNQWARVKKWLLFYHEAKPKAASPGNLFVFGLGMDEAKTIREREREDRISYTLKKNEGVDSGRAGPYARGRNPRG